MRGELNLTGSTIRRSELGTSLRRSEWKAEKERRDKAAALRTIFHGRSAEAVLHARSRTGDAVVLRKKPKDVMMESIDSADHRAQLASSRSAPALKYFEREPAEFAERQQGEAAWQARRLLRGLYRQEMENQGCTFGIPRKWPPPQDAMVDEDRFKSQPMPRTVYAPQPFVVARANMDVTLLKPEPVPRDPNPPKRQAAMKQLRAFGASCSGAPYTLNQVYEEISAKLDHRKPRDVRSSHGTLGPQELGAGTSLDRRELPFARGGSSRGAPGRSSPKQTSVLRAAIQDVEAEKGGD